VDELATIVNIALGELPEMACPHGLDPGEPVTVTEILQAVVNVLEGCPQS
jgi:hypothetical protein